MKTKITLYFAALTLMLSSCAKETYYFSNNNTSYGSTKKEQPVPTTPVISTEDLEALSAETPAPETFYASTEKVAVSKKELTRSKALYHKPVSAPAKEQKVSKVAQVKAAIKLTKQIKAIKKADKQGMPAEAASGKSQIVAALLAFFLGGFGVHRFYLGYTGKGILQIALVLVGAALSTIFIGIPILLGVSIWILIDFIRILTGNLKPKNGEYTSTL